MLQATDCINILRLECTPECTIGVLRIGSEVLCATLELPWRGNQPNVSCIPCGVYTARRVNSPKYGDTFCIADVHGRGHILFHWGNFVRDTLGCVLLGELPSCDEGERRLPPTSRATFTRFMEKLKGVDEFQFSITYA